MNTAKIIAAALALEKDHPEVSAWLLQQGRGAPDVGVAGGALTVVDNADKTGGKPAETRADTGIDRGGQRVPAEAVKEPVAHDCSQDWAGMNGATAWQLIYRNADGWGDIEKMMKAWLAANAGDPHGARTLCDAAPVAQDATKDAQRYQWLRVHCLSVGHGSIGVYMDDRARSGNLWKQLCLDELDADLDAAIALTQTRYGALLHADCDRLRKGTT
jgi:hypothetical protein